MIDRQTFRAISALPNVMKAIPADDDTTVDYGRIYNHSDIQELALGRRDWHFAAFRELDEVLADASFPCLFSRRAWRDKTDKLLFCARPDDGGAEHFRQGVLDYTMFVKSTPVKDRLFAPLVAFVDGFLGTQQRDDHHRTAWQLLQGLLDADHEPWPVGVPTDPNDPLWTFCFNGVQLFFNISTPAHDVLSSRRLGSYLNFVVNPRENFDVVASAKEKSGQLVRQKIRDRVCAYNAGYLPAELGFFGDIDNSEWKQFQLGEPGMSGPATCPLKSRSPNNMESEPS